MEMRGNLDEKTAFLQSEVGSPRDQTRPAASVSFLKCPLFRLLEWPHLEATGLAPRPQHPAQAPLSSPAPWGSWDQPPWLYQHLPRSHHPRPISFHGLAVPLHHPPPFLPSGSYRVSPLGITGSILLPWRSPCRLLSNMAQRIKSKLCTPRPAPPHLLVSKAPAGPPGLSVQIDASRPRSRPGNSLAGLRTCLCYSCSRTLASSCPCHPWLPE